MNKKPSRKRPQSPKPVTRIENKRWNSEQHALGSSSAASPHRNKARYDRRDDRRAKQTGAWA